MWKWKPRLPRPLSLNCLLCGEQSQQHICQPCLALIEHNHKCCKLCALPLSISGETCGECLKKAPDYDQLIAPFIYQAPLSNLIMSFKQSNTTIAHQLMCKLFCEAIAEFYTNQPQEIPQTVTPVPLYWLRHLQRGFNQAAMLSYSVSCALNIEHKHLFKRVKTSKEQKLSSRKQRLKNLKDSFIIEESVTGKHIAIVDDVMTTGATVNQLATLLKQAGASSVSVWLLARTPLRQDK